MATMPLADLATGIRKHTMKMDSNDPLKMLVMNTFARRFAEAASIIEDLETKLGIVGENCSQIISGYDSITTCKLSAADKMALVRENIEICQPQEQAHANAARNG
jgi:hypothetical protein